MKGIQTYSFEPINTWNWISSFHLAPLSATSSTHRVCFLSSRPYICGNLPRMQTEVDRVETEEWNHGISRLGLSSVIIYLCFLQSLFHRHCLMTYTLFLPLMERVDMYPKIGFQIVRARIEGRKWKWSQRKSKVGWLVFLLVCLFVTWS